MAKKTVAKYFSDLSGTEIDDASPTVRFAFDGSTYEIDLTPDEKAAFHDALALYIASGRRVTSPRGRRASAPSDGPSARDIRAWAQEQGLDVPARGRVPAPVVEAYRAAH